MPGTYVVFSAIHSSDNISFHLFNFRCPIYTFYTIMSSMYEDAGEGSLKSQFPYHWLKASWYHYLHILDIDYANGFKCPSCSVEGNTPNIIICDATSLAFRRELLQDLSNLSTEIEDIVLDGW